MIKGFKWVRPLRIEKWKDGDTAEVLIDRGDGEFYRPLKGIRIVYANGKRFDAPEKEDLVRYVMAKDAAERLCPFGCVYESVSHALQKGVDVYGRPLISIKLDDGRDFATAMAEMGHVK